MGPTPNHEQPIDVPYVQYSQDGYRNPTAFLTESAAAASIGLINSLGNLGGFVGPLVMGYLVHRTRSFNAGLLYLVGSLGLSGILMLAVGVGRRRVASSAAPEG